MSDKILRSFEENRNNPYNLKHVRLCHNLAELAKIPEPKVGGLHIFFSEINFIQYFIVFVETLNQV